MSCRHCGLKLRKGDRFVVVGDYPSWWKNRGFSRLLDGPEYFGELYHEVCYLESVGKYKIIQKERGKS